MTGDKRDEEDNDDLDEEDDDEEEDEAEGGYEEEEGDFEGLRNALAEAKSVSEIIALLDRDRPSGSAWWKN